MDKKYSRTRKRRKGADPELGQAAPVEAAPRPVNNTEMKACTEQGDRKKRMVTTVIAEVKGVTIDDMAHSRTPDPSGDKQEDEEDEVGGDSGAEREPANVSVSCAMP